MMNPPASNQSPEFNQLPEFKILPLILGDARMLQPHSNPSKGLRGESSG
jgi:hypothetical protein